MLVRSILLTIKSIISLAVCSKSRIQTRLDFSLKCLTKSVLQPQFIEGMGKGVSGLSLKEINMTKA